MYICNCSYTSKLKAVLFFGLILSLCCACSRAGAHRVSSYDHYWVKAADERGSGPEVGGLFVQSSRSPNGEP